MPMKTITVESREIQTIQQNAAAAIGALEKSASINTQTASSVPIQAPFTGGHILTGVALASGSDNLIPHKLERQPQVWVITDNNSNSVIWSPASSQLGNKSSTEQYLNLRCSASTTVSLWVA